MLIGILMMVFVTAYLAGFISAVWNDLKWV